MTKKNVKIEKILDVALRLLKTQGDYGVTMRQVATKAEMSLSNVQYYFKNKDELLKALADRYFARCLQQITALDVIDDDERADENIKVLLHSFLVHGLELSEMCRIFREYWAMSTRNEVIEQYLHHYYCQLATIMADKLRAVSIDELALHQAVSLIIPYVEGYSITAKAMPVAIDEVTEMLSQTVKVLLITKRS